MANMVLQICDLNKSFGGIHATLYGEVIATGAPGEIRANADVRRAYLGEE